jgi:hypothetical protein
MSTPSQEDQAAADAEQRARQRLTARAGAQVPRLPWLADGQPHDAVTLIRDALWRANTDRSTLEIPDDLCATITLLAAARSEIDQLEAGALFVARAEGLTWAQIAEALGSRTAQAGQQRYERVVMPTRSKWCAMNSACPTDTQNPKARMLRGSAISSRTWLSTSATRA